MLACILFVFGALVEYACLLFDRGFDEEEEREEEEGGGEEEEATAMTSTSHENKLFGRAGGGGMQEQVNTLLTITYVKLAQKMCFLSFLFRCSQCSRLRCGDCCRTGRGGNRKWYPTKIITY